MILNQKQTTLAYRCPACGATVFSAVGAFSLSGDLFRLKCPCGESELTVTASKDGKYRLLVPCFLCPNPHNYVVAAPLFFGRDCFTLSCNYSGVDICFIGNEDAVKKSLDISDRELYEMLGEVGINEFSGGDKVFTDPQVLDIVSFVVHDLEETGDIHCRCPEGDDAKMPDGESKYYVDIGDDCVTVICRKCGAQTIVPAGSTIAANAFLHADRLELH